jgi:hypothetical protein
MLALYRRFFAGLPVRQVLNDGHLHLLNLDEIRTIRRRHRQALVIAALLSVAGFLAYFLPVYALPGWFPAVPLTLPWIGEVVFPWAETVWGLLLMVVEIYLLVLLNLWGVHEIAVATGLIDAGNKDARTAELLGIGLEDRHTGLLQYGIDPFLGLNRWLLVAMNLVLRLKGFLGSKFLRYLVQRLLGRFAVREVLDFVGMPIYMAINAYSTHVVLREARVVIMGRQLVEHLTQRLPAELATDAVTRELLYDTLEFIAVSKRDFHRNHFLLTRALIDRYAIAVKPVHPLPTDYLGKLRGAPAPLREACTLLIVLGFVLDGHISLRERRRIAALQAAGVLPYDQSEVRAMCAAFVSGEGLAGLIDRHVQ